MAALDLHALVKAYGAQPVVRSLDLHIPSGARCVLLGPSGCGKTTTLRMVAGLEAPDQGRITMGGEPVVDVSAGVNVPPERRGLGMVFQSYALWPHLSVADNVAYPLRRTGVAAADVAARVEEALRTVQLPGLGTRLPHALSGGQQQRVALARALVARPRVLLMDEPMSNLDARLRDGLRADIAALCERHGITLMHVTHDQAEAMALGTMLCVMNGGRIEQQGPPRDVYAAPDTLFVASFLGDTHVLRGHVSGPGGVDVGGLSWRGRVVGEAPRGAPCSVAVRPEDAQLADDGALRGSVVVSACVGAAWLVDVSTPAGTLRVASTRHESAGTPVGVHVHGGHAFTSGTAAQH